MDPSRNVLLTIFVGLTALAAAAGASTGPECLIRLSAVAHPPRFDAYPATIVRTAAVPARVAAGEAHRYRSLLRAGAAGPPNFAGRFRIVLIGCGSSCTDFAIVDAPTGRIFFVPPLRGVSTVHAADTGLYFRRDSRLLVLAGAPKEDERRDGLLFLEWTGTRFRTLRWVPRRLSCSTEPVRG